MLKFDFRFNHDYKSHLTRLVQLKFIKKYGGGQNSRLVY